MPRRIFSFDLDINKADTKLKFTAKDYEDLLLEITVKNKAEIINLEGCTIDFADDCNNSEIIEVINNVINIKFKEIRIGSHVAELVIMDGEGCLKTPSFYFYIEKSISGDVVIGYKQLIDSEGYILKDSENNHLKVRG